MDQPHSCGGLFFIGVVFPLVFLGGWTALKGIPLWKPFCNWNRYFFWWNNCEASDSKSILFWLVHGGVWHINIISTSGNIRATSVFFFANGSGSQLWRPIFYWGGFSLIVSWGVNSSEGHPPLKTIFALEMDALLMKQLWSFWFQVNSVLVGSWWSLAHQ